MSEPSTMSIPAYFTQYTNDIPANWKSQTVKAFAFGFVLRTITRENPVAGLVAGSVAAVATLIHTAITPFFKQYVTDPTKPLSFDQEMVRSGISMIGAAGMLYAYGDKEIFHMLYYEAIIVAIRATNETYRSLQNAQWMFFFPSYDFIPHLPR